VLPKMPSAAIRRLPPTPTPTGPRFASILETMCKMSCMVFEPDLVTRARINGDAIDIQKVNIAAALVGRRFNQRG